MAENAEKMSDKEHESERTISELTNSSDDTKATLAYDTFNSVKELNETMQNVQASSEELLKMAEELHKIMGSFQL